MASAEGNRTLADAEKDPPPFLRFRLTYLDSVQSSPSDLPPAPTSADRSTPFIPARRIPFAPDVGKSWSIDRVPELRVFGATEAGQRCCIHIHGALPYIYLEYEGKVAPEEIHNYINRLARAINVCMAASLGRRDPSKSLFVAFIVPVKAIPFYGFHVGYRYFLKIYCLDPKYMTRMATLLRSGEIMQKRWIVYESHIPFLLQFMLDANLYGCGWVNISKAKFREPVPDDLEVDSSGDSSEYGVDHFRLAGGQGGDDPNILRRHRPRLYTRSNIPSSMLYASSDLSPIRVSHSALEFDIHVSWIQNRHLIKERNLHSDFTEFLKHPISDDFKFVHSVRELWEDERRRRKMKGVEGPIEISENSAEELLAGFTAGPKGENTGAGDISSDLDARLYCIGTQPPWQRFNENKARFQDLVEKDRLAYASLHPHDPIPRFETFVRKEKKGGWMEKIQTSFQSVEALFEETLEMDEQTNNPFGAWAVRGIGVSMHNGRRSTTTSNSNVPMKKEYEHDDVNPQYLALLGTQAGRERLAQMEEDDAKLEAIVDHESENELDGFPQPSDEEELNDQEEKRDIQEKAKELVGRTGIGRKEAWEEEVRKRRDSLELDAKDATPHMPANAENTKGGGGSPVEADNQSKRSTTTSADETDTRLFMHQGNYDRLPGSDSDPDLESDIALLNQLIPNDTMLDEAADEIGGRSTLPTPSSKYIKTTRSEVDAGEMRESGIYRERVADGLETGMLLKSTDDLRCADQARM